MSKFCFVFPSDLVGSLNLYMSSLLYNSSILSFHVPDSSREIALNNYGKDSPALRQKTDIAIAIHPTAKGESLFQDVSESGQRDVWIYPSDHALDINDHHNIQSVTFYNRRRDFEVIAHQRNTPDGPVRTVSRSLKDLQTENSIAPIHNYDTDEDEDEDEHEDEEDKIEKDGEDDKDGEDQDDRHGGSGSVMVVFSGLMVPMSYDNNEGSDDSRENASEESYDTGAYHNGDYDDDDDDDDDHIQSYLNDINEENEDDDSEVGDCREDVDEDDWNDEEEKGDYNPYEGDEEDYYVFGEFYADDVEYEEEDIRTDEEDENNGSSDKEDDSGDGNDYSDYDGNDDDDDWFFFNYINNN